MLCGRRNAPVGPSGDDGEGSARHRFDGGPERCHRQSHVKTRLPFVKLQGQRLMAWDFDRQVAKFQVFVAVKNGFTVLGIPVTKAGDESVQG